MTLKKPNSLKRECRWFCVCPVKYLTEKNIIDDKWIKLYCMGDWDACVRFQMEERGEYHPDNMLPDGSYI